MDPESDTPVSRIERTFWTFWYYVTGAVNRFLRPEPTNIVSSDPNSLQESAADTAPEDNSLTHGNTRRGELDEEPPLPADSLLKVSATAVAWEPCKTEECEDFKEDEEFTEHKTLMIGGGESKVSEEGESQTEKDEAGQLTPKDNEEEAESTEDADYKVKLNTEPLIPTDNGMSEIIDEEISRAMVPDESKKMEETIQIQDDQVLEEEDNIEIKLCTITDSSLEEDNMHMDQAKVQRDDTTTEPMCKQVETGSGHLQLLSKYENRSDDGETPASQISVCELWPDSDPGVKLDTGKDQMTAHRSESDEAEDDQEEENENMLHEREQSVKENMSKAENEQMINEEQEQEDNIKIIREESQGNDMLAKSVACSIDDLQNAKPELDAAQFTDVEEEEDVANNSEMQRKTRETDDVSGAVYENSYTTSADVSVTDSFFDKNHIEEEKVFMETAHKHTSNAFGPEAGTGLEINGEFKNISLRMCEGEVEQELNSPTCAETQEGVPEYNNELGLDENSTQRFLEVVDCKEIQTSQLPEEVGSQESETLQNSSHNTGADYSLEVEQRNREQENTDNNSREDAGIVHYTRPAEQGDEESGVVFDKAEEKLLVLSMKTKTKHSEKELESDVGLRDDKTTTEQQDGTVELLVECETNEGFSDRTDNLEHSSEMMGAVTAEKANEFAEESSKFIDVEAQKMADTSFFQECVQLDQQRPMVPSLLESIIGSVSMKHPIEAEPQTTDNCRVDMQSAVIDCEETAFGLEEGAASNEMQSKNLMEIFNLQLISPLKEKDQKESALFTRSEVDEVVDISTKAGDEFTTDQFKEKDVDFMLQEEIAKAVTETEMTQDEEESSPISGKQDVIDEEILDLWIQAASSENTDDIKQQEEPQQTDVKIKQSNTEQNEVSVQAETETETRASRFLDQSICMWDPQNSQNQPNHSEQQFKSQDNLIEEEVRTGQSDLFEEESLTKTGIYPDLEVLSSEATQDIFQKGQVELELTETREDTKADITSPETAWKEIEDTDIKSPKLKFEEITFEEVTASQTPDEFQLFGESQSDLEVQSEEEIISTEVVGWTESEKLFQLQSSEKEQPGWSAESVPERSEAEIVEQLKTESEGLIEVDASTLNFTAQKSRIAVKNPRVRPPKDARSLLNMPSVEPTPSSNLPVKVPPGVPLGALGIGIKLPGIGGGFPVLKKKRVEREENSSETAPKEPETKPEDRSDPPEADEVQPKPKWMPPKQLGFGNPLMSELKTKLKKPTKE